jgi:2-polyprenyl-6-methoxyphenol hydroxylase-like FAD-dependent oxidoreductase
MKALKVTYPCISGDSCHVMVPVGGFGMNTGVLDAYDLGWKLVATLKGWGGEKLLASYTVRPVIQGVNKCSNFQTLFNWVISAHLDSSHREC